jgi:PIN domain nuclease of toxin-antitoxin system
VRLLLDTQIFIWARMKPERIGPRIGLLQDPENDLHVSAASGWEIAIKYSAGRLPLPELPERWVPRGVVAIGATSSAVEMTHALAVSRLPPIHRDPFDRLLVAQAQVSGLTLMTADATVASYPVDAILV